MAEGSLYCTYRFPQPWPPPRDVQLPCFKSEDALIELLGRPDGRISITSTTGHPPVTRTVVTQPVQVTGRGWADLAIVWRESEISFYLAGREVRLGEGETAVFAVVTQSPTERVEAQLGEVGPVSLDHPNARAACQPWLSWRSQYAGAPVRARTGRRPKSDADELRELREQVAGLKSGTQRVLADSPGAAEALAAQLRTLVCWNDPSPGRQRTHHPLLLRMAGRIDAPLPVFGFPALRPPPPLSPALHVLPSGPVLVQDLPDQRLMDFQEWLLTPAMIENVGLPNERVTLVRDLIGDYANTAGGAHSDRDLPETVDILGSISSSGLDGVRHLLVEVGLITAALGDHLLAELQRQGFGR